MNKIIGCFIMAVIVSAFCACQATPQKNFVVNKNDDKLEQTIKATPAPSIQQVIDKDKWEEDYTIPNLNCAINAEIIVPDTNVYPVYKVKKHLFDSASVDKLVRYLTKEATGVRQTSPTKEELTAQLIAAKRGMYVEDDNGERWESYDGQEQRIAKLEEQIENATEESFEPITDQISPIPFKLTYAMPSGARLHVEAKESSVYVTADKYGVIQGESWLGDGGAIPGEPPGTTIEGVKISKEEANAQLNTLLSELGINNYGIAEAEEARVVFTYTSEIISKGWQFILTRNDGGGIPVNLYATQFGGLLDFRSEEYAERWKQDMITVYIDETGVRFFSWNDPFDITETLNENVALLPFDEVKDRIKNMIKFAFPKSVENGWLNGENIMSVDKIVLTNILIPMKDDSQHQMMIPAWLVYNTYYLEYNGQIVDESKSVFAVNAIDGSSIDLSMRSLEFEAHRKQALGY